jgi:two-component system, NarL family, nitrate/nitrite response regulator NarL
MTSTHGAKLRIYLIDDHPVVREGFARAVADEPDLQVVGQAATASEGLAEAKDVRPDVVLVDLNLPDRDGPELIAALREVIPEAKLVVVSGYDDEYRVAEALRAGAHGYLLKTSTLHELIDGIRTAASGGTPLSARLADAVLRAMRKPGKHSTGTIEALTAREIQVLRLFATGLSTREVAANLGISPKTVETHRIRIYEKLGCKSVVDLTRIAVRTGLVEA